MELRHIRYFQVLAEELNFSRAAKRLHIAQPPLSRQIQELEEEIGAQLLYRTKRHVELTNAGRAFLKKSYKILDLVEEATINARLSAAGTSGEFYIGFTGTVQDMIPSLKLYREQFPHVRIILKQMNNDDQIEALNNNKIDLALVSVPIKDDNIQLMPIKKMNFVAALPEKHPLVHKSSLYLRDLADEEFIMTPKSVGCMYYDKVMSVFENNNLKPNVTIQAHDLQTVLVLVAAGMGVTLTPSPIQALNGIVHREIEDLSLAIVGSMAWRKNNKSELLEKFLSFFLKHYRKVIDSADA